MNYIAVGRRRGAIYPEITYQEFLLRIMLAALCGGAVGIEREKHGRAAGFRTNILVCVGSTLVMMCSQQIFTLFSDLPGMQSVARVDPSRIASGIIMGIGFLGAGAIIRTESFTRGLTTAACLWLVTAVGIALGLGEYIWGSATTVVALLVLLPLKRLERLLPVDRYGTIEVTGKSKAVNRDAVSSVLNDFKISTLSYTVRHDNARQEAKYVFTVKYAGQLSPDKVTETLAALEGVSSVEWR